MEVTLKKPFHYQLERLSDFAFFRAIYYGERGARLRKPTLLITGTDISRSCLSGVRRVRNSNAASVNYSALPTVASRDPKFGQCRAIGDTKWTSSLLAQLTL